MILRITLIIWASIVGQSLWAQKAVDTVHVNNEAYELPDPDKAALYSAVLPGLGQAYNHKYWKIPLIYAGGISIVYFIDWNNDRYQLYRNALFAEIDNNPETENPFPQYSEDRLRSISDQFRRNRDLLFLLGGVLYMLNIVDAHVDAHLKEFDIDEELSVSIEPVSRSTYAGIGIFLNIK